MLSVITSPASSTGKRRTWDSTRRSTGFQSTSAVLVRPASSTRRGSCSSTFVLAQADILDFCVNANYEHKLKWPDDYWPSPTPPSDAAWQESIASFTRSRDKLKALTRDVDDVTAKVPTGKGNQTYLRAILLVADHTAYHVGQLVAVRRALGIWT